MVTNPTFGWDLAKNSTVDISPVGPGAKAPGVATTDYFMLIDGLSGGSTDAKHKNWFDISDFRFNVDNPTSPGDVAIGGAGKPVFSGLSVYVESQAALTNLLGFAANGKLLSGIKIEGTVFDGAGLTPTYDLSLAGVTVKSIQEDFGQGYFVDFGFEQMKLETKGVGDTTTDVAAWNLKTLTTEVSIPTLTPASASSWAAGASDFFMAFDGLKGESFNAKNKGWFDIDSFSFGVETPGGGKAQFDTLTVNFSSEAGLSDFALAISNGTLFQGATLRGMNSLGAIAYNLDLSNAAIVGLSESIGDGLSLQLAFDAFEVTQYKYANTGAYTGGESFGWNLLKNSSATVASVTPSGSLNYAAPSGFFMLVDGMNGGGDDVSHGNWFDVASFSFGVAQPGYVAGGTSVAGEYDGIDIVVTGQHGFTQFMELAATGKLLEGLVIEGVNGAAKGAGGAVYELVLGDIFVTNVTEFGAGYSLHLEFSKIELMTKLADGSVASDFKWDLAANKAGGTLPNVNPLSSDRSETLSGAFGNSTLLGLGGNDIISGMDGNDFIDGGTGNDKMFGGNGFDIASYATATAGVTVNLLTTLEQDTKGAGFDSLSGFEELRGSAFGDRLTGSNFNDTLDGGDGGDILDGRGGIDTMRGGKGEDTYYVDKSSDLVLENPGEGIKDVIFSSVSFDLDFAPNVENLLAAATATAGLKLDGSAGNNNIRGSGFKDTLIGEGGNDTLIGGLEADLMIGGLGNDVYYVDNVSDIVQEAVGEGISDTVFASVNFTLGTGQEIDYLNANAGLTGLTLTGNELTNRIRGSNGGNDALDGGGAGDILYGQAGDDRLAGGLGVDSIYGGTGKDTFVLRNSSLDRDVLLDYVAADDTLEVSAALFGGGLKIGVLGAGQFLSNLDGNVANGGSASTRFIYDSDSGLLYFDADGTGAAGKVLIAQLPSLPSLAFDDILVVA
jgi:Ca2+-binding RTX toxin-like protein